MNDPLAIAAQNLALLQSQKFTGTVVLRLELAEGGIRTCNFSTDHQIHPKRKENKEINVDKNT